MQSYIHFVNVVKIVRFFVIYNSLTVNYLADMAFNL